MDILLDRSGDLVITDMGDIRLENSVAQKIRIRLQWFLNEWRWNREEGLPYYESLFVKSPNTDYFERLVRAKIFEIEEVTAVREVTVTLNARKRTGRIYFEAETDQETIKEEVMI